VALQQALAIDITGLGGAVRGDIVGISDLEAVARTREAPAIPPRVGGSRFSFQLSVRGRICGGQANDIASSSRTTPTSFARNRA
jgi:hypothetical protein